MSQSSCCCRGWAPAGSLAGSPPERSPDWPRLDRGTRNRPGFGHSRWGQRPTLIKRQVFCVKDRLYVVKHESWATMIVAPKSVRSLTTKGHEARWVLLRPGLERTAKAIPRTYDRSITDLSFRKNYGWITILSGHLQRSWALKIEKIPWQNKPRHQFKPLILRIKETITVPIH